MPLESGIQSREKECWSAWFYVSVDATWEWHPIQKRVWQYDSCHLCFSWCHLRVASNQACAIELGFTINRFQLMPLESGIQFRNRSMPFNRFVSVDATWEWHPIQNWRLPLNQFLQFQLMPLESGIQWGARYDISGFRVSVDATWEWHPISGS